MTEPFPPFRLSVEALGVDRGGRRVIEAVDLSLSGGEAVLLTGPNGVGKSTLLRAVAGLIAHSGKVRIELSGGDADEAGRCMHYLGHRDAVKPTLSVIENLAFWCDFLGPDGGAAPEAALAVVGLAELKTLPAAWLSAGQRRRLAIARLVAVRRPLWLLDEPTAALDAASEAMLAGLMADHIAAGGAIIAATHQEIGLKARRLRLETEAEAC